MAEKKGISTTISIFIVFIFLGVFAFQHFFIKSGDQQQVKDQQNSQQIGPVACAQDSKICPDGSVVVRTGSGCQFAACLENKNYLNSPIAEWTVYKNNALGFSISYPKGLLVDDFFCAENNMADNFNPLLISCYLGIINTIEPIGLMSSQRTVCSLNIKIEETAGFDYSLYLKNEEVSVTSTGYITLSGIKGKKIKTTQFLDEIQSAFYTYIFIEKGQYIYIFNYGGEQDADLNLCDKIVSTFKFKN